jgi:site-specific recombinase XerD
MAHYSQLTEKAYVGWIRRYILFHGGRQPVDLGANEVRQFLSHLASTSKVSATTQNQALSALLFLYRKVLAIDLPWIDDVVRAKKPARLPIVLSANEVRALLNELSGVHWLVASLLYGSGLRLMECLRLRVKDIDFAARQILVRGGKGNKDRVTLLANSSIRPLQQHLSRQRERHAHALARGSGEVYLAAALSRK